MNGHPEFKIDDVLERFACQAENILTR